MNGRVTIFEDKFENEKTGEAVPGITIVLDGDIRRVLDTLLTFNPQCRGYVDIVQTALFTGISDMIGQTRGKAPDKT